MATMIRAATKFPRASITAVRVSPLISSPFSSPPSAPSSTSFRLTHGGIEGSSAAQIVAHQMINYAVSHARSQKSGSFLVSNLQSLSSLVTLVLFFLVIAKLLTFLLFLEFPKTFEDFGFLLLTCY